MMELNSTIYHTINYSVNIMIYPTVDYTGGGLQKKSANKKWQIIETDK